MDKPKTIQSRRSMLLSKDLSLKDLGLHDSRIIDGKTSEIMKTAQSDGKNSDYERQLFVGLKYKKLGSIQTADCEDANLQEKALLKQYNQNSLEREKMRLKLQRLSNGEKKYDASKRIPTQPDAELKNSNVKTLRQIRKSQQVIKLNNAMKLSKIINSQDK